jgi:type II secretory pathway component GspD/PulD (secretin)
MKLKLSLNYLIIPALLSVASTSFGTELAPDDSLGGIQVIDVESMLGGKDTRTPGTQLEVLRVDELEFQSDPTTSRFLAGEALLSYELDRLNSQSPRKIEIPGAPLRDVVHFLADSSQINYLGLPHKSEPLETKVTTFMVDRPFSALSRLCDTYGIGYSFDAGNWHFYPIDNSDLVAATYELKYNNQEEVSGSSSSLNDQLSNGSSGGLSGNSNTLNNNNTAYGSGSGSGRGGGSGSGGNSFSVNADKLQDEIKQLLDVSANSGNLLYQATGSVDSFEELPIYKPRPLNAMDEGGSENKGSVIYNSDTSSLFVIASRFHHKLIRDFLTQIDKPLPQVHIDTRMIESSRDPSEALGVDWSGVTETSLNLNGLSTSVDLNDLGATAWPSTALLSADDLSITLTAISKDGQSTMTSQPRLSTVSNRPVSLKSVVNQPVSAGTTETSAGTTTSTSSLRYIDVGTTINILPRVIEGGKTVTLNVVISVSGISGFEVIDGNETPITTERVFNFEVKVPNGYTLAVGGLESIVASESEQRVPYMSRIPILGRVFETKSDSQNANNLMLMITPTILMPDIDPESLAEFPERREDISINKHEWKNTGNETARDCFLELEDIESNLNRLAAKVRQFRANSTDVYQLQKLVQTSKEIQSRVYELYPIERGHFAVKKNEDRNELLSHTEKIQARALRILDIAMKSPNSVPSI